MVTIRSEEPGDCEAIHAVHKASFPTPAEARLVDALRAAGHLRFSLVALEGEAIVGHVAFSPVEISGGIDGVGLAPVAVLAAFRRRGIAEQLIGQGLAACARSGSGFVVVLGDPHYYSRFGFVQAGTWGLRDVYGGAEAFQALELRRGSIPPGGGVVRYGSEFDAL